MASLSFKNQQLNDKYQILSENDITIITPDGYRGPLTGIGKEEVLQGMIKRRSPLVAEKKPAKPAAPANNN